MPIASIAAIMKAKCFVMRGTSSGVNPRKPVLTVALLCRKDGNRESNLFCHKGRLRSAKWPLTDDWDERNRNLFQEIGVVAAERQSVRSESTNVSVLTG